LDSLFEEHPDIKVVSYGYDFPGSVDEVLSGALWDSNTEVSYSLKALIWMYKLVGIRFINYSAMQYGYTLQKLSEEYSKKGRSFTYVPLWGSLQSAAKQKGSTANTLALPPPSPVLNKPSPSEFMNDPIHANKKGYEILLGNLYNIYFSKVLQSA